MTFEYHFKLSLMPNITTQQLIHDTRQLSTEEII